MTGVTGSTGDTGMKGDPANGSGDLAAVLHQILDLLKALTEGGGKHDPHYDSGDADKKAGGSSETAPANGAQETSDIEDTGSANDDAAVTDESAKMEEMMTKMIEMMVAMMPMMMNMMGQGNDTESDSSYI